MEVNRAKEKTEDNRDLGLYLHIPFCVKKCDYCDFLSAPASDEMKHRYVDALIAEIESYQNKMLGYRISTIFIGGGTPSCIEGQEIQRVLEAIREIFHLKEGCPEVTIEVNPGTVTEEKLQRYHDAGINRISFGLQSVNNLELKLLGRIHSYEEFVDNFKIARKIGFTNINIDLMSALPGQTLTSWENTLHTVLSLSPEHISAYSLIIEEGTKFYDWFSEGAIRQEELPEEETDRRIYHRTKELLESQGYHRYEISNYSRGGYECAHNSSYWLGTEYLGLGLGSSSFVDGKRYKNCSDLNRYIQHFEAYKEKQKDNHGIADTTEIIEDFEQLTRKQLMEEFMYLGLRMCRGISKHDFNDRFGCEIDDVYSEVINNLVQKELIITDGDSIRLTELGIDISNSVLSVFLLD